MKPKKKSQKVFRKTVSNYAHKKTVKHGFKKYVLVFGDSFTGPLKLFNQPNWKIIKFKGATMKGLIKPNNENRLEIIRTIRKYSNANKLGGVIFCFGTVDVQFSYYYTKLFGKSFNNHEIITGYINFIKSVTNPLEYKIGVQLVYPSAVADYNMLEQLNKYFILDNYYGLPERNSKFSDNKKQQIQDIISNIRLEKDPLIQQKLSHEFKMKTRITRVAKFNNDLRKAVANAKLICIDMYKHLVDSHGYVKHQFIDLSALNVHFRWEPQIPYILREFRPFGITDRFINQTNLLQLEKQYLADKKERLKKFMTIKATVTGDSNTKSKTTKKQKPSKRSNP